MLVQSRSIACSVFARTRLLGSAALQRGSPEAGARRGAQGGSIVFVSSYTAYRAEAPIALYAVSKTALVALSKALAEELGPAGIRVNCVAPGARPRPPRHRPPTALPRGLPAGRARAGQAGRGPLATRQTCLPQLSGFPIWRVVLHEKQA